MRNRHVLLAAASLVLLAVLLACAGTFPPPAQTTPGQLTVIRSTDGKCEVRVPAGWTSLTEDMPAEAALRVGNEKEQVFLMVLPESKIDFAPEYTYRDNAKASVENLLKNLKSAKVVRGPTDLSINGRRAIQYEVRGLSKTFQLVYLSTTIDGTVSYYHVAAWTRPSKAEANLAVLEEVTNSFQETK
jgi:hypothetical protein